LADQIEINLENFKNYKPHQKKNNSQSDTHFQNSPDPKDSKIPDYTNFNTLDKTYLHNIDRDYLKFLEYKDVYLTNYSYKEEFLILTRT
jgi:hypothetical protein